MECDADNGETGAYAVKGISTPKCPETRKRTSSAPVTHRLSHAEDRRKCASSVVIGISSANLERKFKELLRQCLVGAQCTADTFFAARAAARCRSRRWYPVKYDDRAREAAQLDATPGAPVGPSSRGTAGVGGGEQALRITLR